MAAGTDFISFTAQNGLTYTFNQDYVAAIVENLPSSGNTTIFTLYQIGAVVADTTEVQPIIDKLKALT